MPGRRKKHQPHHRAEPWMCTTEIQLNRPHAVPGVDKVPHTVSAVGEAKGACLREDTM